MSPSASLVVTTFYTYTAFDLEQIIRHRDMGNDLVPSEKQIWSAQGVSAT